MTATRSPARRVAAHLHLRQRLERVRESFGPILWASIAAGTAVALAGWLLDHPYPFFAAVAAFSALGFSANVSPRRVGEVALGVTVGVWLGEVFQLYVGTGPVQIAVVVLIAACIGRMLDPSPVLTTQSVVQAIVVTGLPAASFAGGPLGRWTDTLIGGACALVFSLFIPKDPRRRPRGLARDVLDELAEILRLVSEALRTGEERRAQEALTRGRGSQWRIVALEEAVAAAGSTARLSPAWRRHRGELASLAEIGEYTDRAVRTARVLARRTAATHGLADPDLADLAALLATAAGEIARDVVGGNPPEAGAATLESVAGRLVLAGERDPVRHSLISLLRSVTFDLLRACGRDEAAATGALP